MADDLELMVPADCGRWPGFSEQSWMERFNELDRRYEAAANNALERAFKYAEAADEITRLRAELAALRGAVATAPSFEAPWELPLGTRVTKTKGSSWTGRVVGFYSTGLTPEGYAIESENEPGSVQIYPRSALRTQPKDEAHG